jgi:hypothetical protein
VWIKFLERKKQKVKNGFAGRGSDRAADEMQHHEGLQTAHAG